jgi:hypothetical protein
MRWLVSRPLLLAVGSRARVYGDLDEHDAVVAVHAELAL